MPDNIGENPRNRPGPGDLGSSGGGRPEIIGPQPGLRVKITGTLASGEKKTHVVRFRAALDFLAHAKSFPSVWKDFHIDNKPQP